MSENINIQPEIFHDYNEAEQYIEAVRSHYRQEHGSYRGTRNEDQQLIAEVTSDEARIVADRMYIGTMAIAGTVGNLIGRDTDGPSAAARAAEQLQDDESPKRGKYSWSDFRNAYSKLLVGFSIITQRLNRDGFDVPSYSDLKAPDRFMVAQALFFDFQRHNALRFGVDTAGLSKTTTKTVHNFEEGTVEEVSTTIDRDKAYTEYDITKNMNTRGYYEGSAQLPAAKISPDKYIELRRQYPDMDKDEFDRSVSFYQDVISEFESRE